MAHMPEGWIAIPALRLRPVQRVRCRPETPRASVHRRWLLGSKRFRHAIPPVCACGCGQFLRECSDRTPGWYAGRFLHGHHARGKTMRIETKEKLRKANAGKIASPATRMKMKEARHTESGLSRSEYLFQQSALKEGWTIYRSGWPDFLLERDGILRFVEVKHHRHGLNPNQKTLFATLKRNGFPVEVVYV